MQLLVPSETAAQLRCVARQDLPDALRSALAEALGTARIHGASAADPAVAEQAPSIISHTTLCSVAAWARTQGMQACTLAQLVRNAQVYIESPRVYQRPKSLDEQLAKIARANEAAEYARMVAPREEPYTVRGALVPADERAAWRQTRSHVSAILNIALSMGAVATAVWWGAGSRSPIWSPLRSQR
ncbi:hypothetical protein MVES1_001404 [Malassezia vespertilionis]|uniref:Uncharacterized protein n=1 Tax=Malassezia vespertilionis TaxID=2020962 RepID=A0A2N1JDU2_9BASI|nr:uncharacterized protein MVES1_001404 [Malassezia vespertilionis]PKI84720.1 hypothetical protein MVES_001324 [Malassezia vespertilionis]WFD06065.1 hypothetical protein MVES1_001404 [Malassezia vespertilionis]